MKEQLIETIERFAKKEILPRLETLEKAEPHSPILSTIMKGASEIGLNHLPLPEDMGGLGLDIPLIGTALRKISEISAGVATIFLFHYAGLFPFLTNEKGKKIVSLISEKEPHMLFATGELLKGKTSISENRITTAGLHAWGIPGAKYLSVYSEYAEKSTFTIISLRDCKITERNRNLGLMPFSSATVSFENIPLDETNSIILPLNEGMKLTNSIYGFINALICAISTGNAEGAYNHTLRYAHERYQGGDIIINHRIIQTMLGKIIARIDASKAYADKILEEAKMERYERAGIAKAFITENCEWACSDCVQVFGGYGYMKDFSVERHLRDAKSLSALTGGNMFKLQEYVKLLKEKANIET